MDLAFKRNAKKHLNIRNDAWQLRFCSLPEGKNQSPKWPDMDTAPCLHASHTQAQKKPITERQWAHGSQIYQKWCCAVNEEGEASPLPIYHTWCIADKLAGSNKVLLRGWPPWWKQQLPHGHRSVHRPLPLNTTAKVPLCFRGLRSAVRSWRAVPRPVSWCVCLQTTLAPSSSSRPQISLPLLFSW